MIQMISIQMMDLKHQFFAVPIMYTTDFTMGVIL